MNLIEIFSIILIHFVADFWLQTEEEGLGKSKNNFLLLEHTLSYTVVWSFIGAIWTGVQGLGDTKFVFIWIAFIFSTLVLHTITDYFTSRITSARYKSNHFYGINGFWFWISLDQFFHFLQLFGVYYLLVKI